MDKTVFRNGEWNNFIQASEETAMSQKELANNLNISQPAVCKIEKNAEDVKLSTLIKYVNALGGHLSPVILPPERE